MPLPPSHSPVLWLRCRGQESGWLSSSPLQVWRFSAGGPIFSSPCISASEQDIIFGSHDCFLYCCSTEGRLRWKFETTARVYSTPFAFPNHLCGSGTLLAAASTDGKLWVLESQSGELRSVYELPGEVFSSPVLWESMLVIGCRNNYIYCLDLSCGVIWVYVPLVLFLFYFHLFCPSLFVVVVVYLLKWEKKEWGWKDQEVGRYEKRGKRIYCMKKNYIQFKRCIKWETEQNKRAQIVRHEDTYL